MAEKTTAFTGPVVVGLNDKKGEIRLTDGKNVNEAKYLSIAAPATITSDTTLTFPNGAGNPGQILSTDGSGNLSWVNDSAGNPGGTVGQVQVNNGATFDGVSEGASGQVLTSNGAGVAPTFQAAPGIDTSGSAWSASGDSVFLESTGQNNPTDYSNSIVLNSGSVKLDGNHPNGVNNVAYGNAAGGNLGAGATDNTFIGNTAGQNTSTGDKNIAIGSEALNSNNGNENIAVGFRALKNNTATGNTAVGHTALFTNTSGTGNTAVGNNAGVSSTSNNNTFVGAYAGDAISFGADNTAVGFEALTQYNATSATAIGKHALKEGGGTNNIGIGPASGFNTNGNSNIFVGQNTGYYAYNSRENVVVGTQSFNGLNGNIVGCTILGYQACTAANQSGTNKIVIGTGAQPSSTSVSHEITLGNSSIATLRCQQTSITALSDARDKKDIEDANIGLDFINDLRPVKFVWDTRDGARKDIKEVGFIAQELDEVQQKHGVEDHLQLVLKNNPDKLEAAPGKLIPILVQAIKDLKKELDELKKA